MVSGLEELFDSHGLAGLDLRNSRTHRDSVRRQHAVCSDASAEPHEIALRGPFISFGEDGNELVATVARDQVHGSVLFDENFGECLQDLVPDRMAERIVIVFE